MTNLVTRAADFAEEAHKGQTRKYTGEPYFNHCRAVAELVKGVYVHYSKRVFEVAMASAYLHDVVEDCAVPLKKIEDEFGVRVAENVFWLTDVSRPEHGNRAFRKQLDRWHNSGSPWMAKTIKLADMIDNAESIVQHDPNFAKVYLKEKNLLLKEMRGGDWNLRSKCKALLVQNRHLWS